jgi:EAL domain-containing protein (putative c-di-GMP-specific phosphodiesterase class I)
MAVATHRRAYVLAAIPKPVKVLPAANGAEDGTPIPYPRPQHITRFQERVAVNLAMHNLLEPGLRDLVVSALNEAGRSPSELTLEITEGAVTSNPEMAGHVLDELAELGCRLSIDDFGTGYSSMAYLQRLPTHELKIDRTFVTGIPQESRNTSIVEASVALAHGLGLTVVAEGVESEANVAALIKVNCDRAQATCSDGRAPYRHW